MASAGRSDAPRPLSPLKSGDALQRLPRLYLNRTYFFEAGTKLLRGCNLARKLLFGIKLF